MEDHVHCCECGHPVATTKMLEDGSVQAVPFKTLKQARAFIHPPEGLMQAMLERPACDECHQKIEDSERLAASRSKLMVAQPGMIPGKPI